MKSDKKTLLQWIERDQDMLITFAGDLIRASSPNPPGETDKVAACITRFLDTKGLEYEIVDPDPDRPNIVASFAGKKPGNALVLNGHMDVLPVVEGESWTYPPWSGAVSDGKIWGRGATNMKCGLAIAVIVYAYLHQMRDRLSGSLTFSAVSEEIVLGDGGTKYLMEHIPEVCGDACLIAEPSGLSTIRFGEKGPMRLRFHIEATGGHGAFRHLGEGAIRRANRLIADIDTLSDIVFPAPDGIDAVLTAASDAADEAQGEGASGIVQRVTVTIAMIRGGVAKNMIPSECEFIADIRLPLGMEQRDVLDRVEEIVARHPETRFDVLDSNPPAWSDPEGDLPAIIRANVMDLKGFEPVPAVSLGCTDARLWRYRGIPCYAYGPPPKGMGGADEHVAIEDFLHVARVHALTAYDFLARS